MLTLFAVLNFIPLLLFCYFLSLYGFCFIPNIASPNKKRVKYRTELRLEITEHYFPFRSELTLNPY